MRFAFLLFVSCFLVFGILLVLPNEASDALTGTTGTYIGGPPIPSTPYDQLMEKVERESLARLWPNMLLIEQRGRPDSCTSIRIRVVDAAGMRVKGASAHVWGIREEGSSVTQKIWVEPPVSVETDVHGLATLSFPWWFRRDYPTDYVSVQVSHPDFDLLSVELDLGLVVDPRTVQLKGQDRGR